MNTKSILIFLLINLVFYVKSESFNGQQMVSLDKLVLGILLDPEYQALEDEQKLIILNHVYKILEYRV